MNPEMIWANLAVSDLDRTTKFYTRLGFTPNGKPNGQLTSFLAGGNKFVMHFFLKDVLQENIKVELNDSQYSNGVIFSLSAKSRGEVDEWAKVVEEAGGTLISNPEEFGEKYYGFAFADPDGNKFNVFNM